MLNPIVESIGAILGVSLQESIGDDSGYFSREDKSGEVWIGVYSRSLEVLSYLWHLDANGYPGNDESAIKRLAGCSRIIVIEDPRQTTGWTNFRRGSGVSGSDVGEA